MSKLWNLKVAVYFFMLAGLQIHNGAALCALVALCEMLNDVD